MENVPWHADVKAFAEALAMEKGGSEYQLACEHAHSCCVLLAKTATFKVNGKWHTWIDYEKFHDLVSVTLSVRQLINHTIFASSSILFLIDFLSPVFVVLASVRVTSGCLGRAGIDNYVIGMLCRLLLASPLAVKTT